MESGSLNLIGILLLVACLSAIVSRKLGLPYIVGLVLAGIVISLLPSAPHVPLSRELMFSILLPPLIFEGALQLPWRAFRRELPLTLTLAIAGVAIAASVVATGLHLILGWSWIGAALFATLIAATDPVSVIAAFKELRAEARLAMVVESESLLNDAVAAVMFAVLLGFAAGQPFDPGRALFDIGWTTGVGIAVGLAAAGAAILVAYNAGDRLIEIALSIVVAYGSFLIAEHYHGSGVLAAMTAGLVFGGFGRARAKRHSGYRDVEVAWDVFAFLANSFVFLLIGMNSGKIPLGPRELGVLGVAILLVLAGRALAVFPLAATFRPSRLAVPLSYQLVLVWGGLRGALALALALAVPDSVPERGPIIAAAFAVVAFSILVQGLTMPVLLRRLKVTRAEPDEQTA